MNRRPSTQDLTWLIDLDSNKQLNLDPPYQRRSVWTRKDKQFFLDTIFRNYPSPAIFLHKTINEAGKSTYHVVDGKQRTSTILEFLKDKIRISDDYGDIRLNGKKWSQLQDDLELKRRFWNYQITIEMIDILEEEIINVVFDRLNRNSRRLTRQELRHAKYDGWFISVVEEEVKREDWKKLGLTTIGREKRMQDVQFISELFFLVLENKMHGFDQDGLDELYAKYDSLDESEEDLKVDEEEFSVRIDEIKSILLSVEDFNNSISTHGRNAGNFYTLWSVIALSPAANNSEEIATRYRDFMMKVEDLAKAASSVELEEILRASPEGELTLPFQYLNNLRGASTDLSPRIERHLALKAALIQEQ